MCFILALVCPCSLHEVDKVVDEMADLVVDMKVDKVPVRALLPCVGLPECPAPPPLHCRPAAGPDRCSPPIVTPGGNAKMRQ